MIGAWTQPTVTPSACRSPCGAAGRLRKPAYDLFLEHQPHLGWSEFAKYGATPGTQVLGVRLDLPDGRVMSCGLTVRMSQDAFSVEADIGVHAPEDEEAENGGYRCLLEIPEAFAGSLDEYLPLIDSRVDQLMETAPHFLRELRAGA